MPSICASPARITPGATVAMTLYGASTNWTTSAPSPTGSGLTFSDGAVVNDTVATFNVTATNTQQTVQVTDAGSGATFSISVRRPNRWIPSRR